MECFLRVGDPKNQTWQFWVIDEISKMMEIQFFGSCYFPYRKLWWTVIGGSPKRFSEKSIPKFWPFPSQLLVEKIALVCWWFGTWLLFSPIVGMMIQSDFHSIIFQRVAQPPVTNQPCFCSSTFKFSWDFYLRTYRINLDSGGFAQKKHVQLQIQWFIIMFPQ